MGVGMQKQQGHVPVRESQSSFRPHQASWDGLSAGGGGPGRKQLRDRSSQGPSDPVLPPRPQPHLVQAVTLSSP